MKFTRIASVLVPPGSARGKVLHDYLLEPLALGLASKGFSHESRELYAWSKARHVPERLPEEGYPRRLIDRASERLASVADRWVECDAANVAEDAAQEPPTTPAEAAEYPASHRRLMIDPNDQGQSAAADRVAPTATLRAAS